MVAMPKALEATMPAMTLGFIAGEGDCGGWGLDVPVEFEVVPVRRNSSAGSSNPLDGRVLVAPPVGLWKLLGWKTLE